MEPLILLAIAAIVGLLANLAGADTRDLERPGALRAR
jgi:hypothetical protein